MGERGVARPDGETLIEGLVSLLRLPYPVGCAVLALIIGPTGAFLATYLEVRDPAFALSNTVTLFVGQSNSSIQLVSSLALLILSLFYVTFAIRYLRSKVMKAEEKLTPLLPEGTERFHQLFGRISRRWPPLILTAIFAAVLASTSLQNFSAFVSGPITLVYLFVAYPLWFLIICTFIWVYFSSIRGLYDLGAGPLRLKAYVEDRMLGVRPVGSLSLSFALSYFGAIGLLALIPLILAPAESPSFLIVLIVLTLWGIVVFFLPLQAIHSKMSDSIGVERRMLVQRLRALQTPESPGGGSQETSLNDLRDELRRLTGILTLDLERRELGSIPSWPFDTDILGKFAAILISVAAIILSRYVAIALHI